MDPNGQDPGHKREDQDQELGDAGAAPPPGDVEVQDDGQPGSDPA